ncbi:MAG: MCE family protein [Nocardia sp.]|nr:MCE family protein [Nocardia sp.]
MAATKSNASDGVKRFFDSGAGLKLSGLILVLILAGVISVALTMFVGGFTTTAPVYLNAPRAGLVMDKDAKVKIRGVDIGHVTDIAYTGDHAHLTLAINPDDLKMVPANATADIRSTTVFGAKYVDFIEPQEPSAHHLPSGATLSAKSVTVEFNTLFQQLTDVLNKVDPSKLNATLTALGTALQGRGDKLGQLMSDSDQFLKSVNPSLPQLRRDLQSTAGVTNLYADVAPNLLRTTDNATVTSKTLVNHKSSLDAVLLNVSGLADTTGGVLKQNEKNLSTALDLLRPTATLLNEYKPALYCLVEGIDGAIPRANQIFGGLGPWVNLDASFMPGGTSYSYPKDLPKVNAHGGPHCEGILDRIPGSHSNYLVTDTTQGRVYTPELSAHLNGPKVFQWLFADLPGVGHP